MTDKPSSGQNFFKKAANSLGNLFKSEKAKSDADKIHLEEEQAKKQAQEEYEKKRQAHSADANKTLEAEPKEEIIPESKEKVGEVIASQSFEMGKYIAKEEDIANYKENFSHTPRKLRGYANTVKYREDYNREKYYQEFNWYRQLNKDAKLMRALIEITDINFSEELKKKSGMEYDTFIEILNTIADADLMLDNFSYDEWEKMLKSKGFSGEEIHGEKGAYNILVSFQRSISLEDRKELEKYLKSPEKYTLEMKINGIELKLVEGNGAEGCKMEVIRDEISDKATQDTDKKIEDTKIDNKNLEYIADLVKEKKVKTDVLTPDKLKGQNPKIIEELHQDENLYLITTESGFSFNVKVTEKNGEKVYQAFEVGSLNPLYSGEKNDPKLIKSSDPKTFWEMIDKRLKE